MRINLRDERGSTTVWVAVLLGSMLVGFGGLVYDAGGAATTRSEINDAAWSLARTGASQLELNGSIDVAAAEAAINESASRQWPDMTITTTVGVDQVTVTINGTYTPQILSVVGVGPWDLTATRTSTLNS